MKEKITKKELKRFKVYNIGCYKLQHLLTFEEADYYLTRIEGWASDIYCFGPCGCIALSNGYAPTGKKVESKILNKYDERARKFLEKTHFTKSYKYQKAILNRWIQEFLKEIEAI